MLPPVTNRDCSGLERWWGRCVYAGVAGCWDRSGRLLGQEWRPHTKDAHAYTYACVCICFPTYESAMPSPAASATYTEWLWITGCDGGCAFMDVVRCMPWSAMAASVCEHGHMLPYVCVCYDKPSRQWVVHRGVPRCSSGVDQVWVAHGMQAAMSLWWRLHFRLLARAQVPHPTKPAVCTWGRPGVL